MVPVLIDTGAAYSCISKSFCKNEYPLKRQTTVLNFENNPEQYNHYEKVILKLEGLEPFKLKIMISNYDKNYLLLGNDFLENFDYEIKEDYLTLDNKRISRIKLHHETILKILE